MSERKRRRAVKEEEEEEEVRNRNRRLSARKRNRVRYNKEDDDDDDEEELDGEQRGPSTQNTHTLKTPEKKNLKGRVLPVTCGNKKGMLDTAKLARGEKCIESEGLCFTPHSFEKYAGRGCIKKWKESIRYENNSLQVLFKNGDLTTPGYNQIGAHTKQKKILSLDHKSESSSEESEEKSEEKVDSDDVGDEVWLPNNGGTASEQAADTEEEAEQRSRGEQENKDEDSGAEEEMEYGEDGRKEDVTTQRKPDDDGDDSVCKGRRPKTKRVLKIHLKRLSEDKTNHHSNCTEPPKVEDWHMPLDEDVILRVIKESDEDDAGDKDDAAITAPTHTDSSRMSEPPITARSSSEVKRKEIGDWEDKDGELERKSSEEKEYRSSDAHGQSRDSGDTTEKASTHSTANLMSHSPVPVSRTKETREETSVILVPESTRVLQVLIKAAHSPAMETEERLPGAIDASDSSEMEGPLLTRPTASSNVDTMNLHELKKEKVKMQLKVLQLQAEYYSIKINKLKQ